MKLLLILFIELHILDKYYFQGRPGYDGQKGEKGSMGLR